MSIIGIMSQPEMSAKSSKAPLPETFALSRPVAVFCSFHLMTFLFSLYCHQNAVLHQGTPDGYPIGRFHR